MPDFRARLKAVSIRTVWYCHRNGHMDQWNRGEHPDVDPQLYGQLRFGQAGKTIHGGKKDSLFHKGFWEHWTATCRGMNLDHSSHTKHKDKLKMDEASKCETRFHQNPPGEHGKQHPS